MRTHNTLMAVMLCILFLPPASRAAEGMFRMDNDAPLLMEKLKKTGLRLDENSLRALRKSVIQVNYGGTGSFVSPKGLIVTNHHVAYGCISTLDTMQEHKGILEEGFAAAEMRDEIPCPGFEILVVNELRDVSDDVKSRVGEKASGSDRFEKIRLAKEDITKECESGEKNICTVSEVNGGTAYLLSVYSRIRDVRLVYAPEKNLGKFGGDTDNWMYPRHTADFTFLRAYVNENGEGTAHSTSNVPYRPDAYLKVSGDGIARDDFVMVMGFPGRTQRHIPSAVARFAVEVEMPFKQKLYSDIIEIIRAESEKSDDANRRYNWVDWALNNAVKYYSESRANFKKWKVIENRMESEKKLASQLSSDPGRLQEYEKLMSRLNEIYEGYGKYYAKFAILERLSGWALPSIQSVSDIARWAVEKDKTDRMRKLERYKDKNVHKFVDASDRLDGRITIDVEKALCLYLLKRARGLDAGQRPRFIAKLLKRARAGLKKMERAARRSGMSFGEYYEKELKAQYVDDELARAVDWMYGTTGLLAHSTDNEEMERAKWKRRFLLYDDGRKTRKFRDPLLDFIRDAIDEFDALRYGEYAEVEQEWDTEIRPGLISRFLKPAYPDANFTLRMSYGDVRDYHETATGKTHRYITDLAGLIAKDTGEGEFIAPGKLKQVAESGDLGRFVDSNINDIPLNFTATLDTTGGNSGSPVLDAHGRLVGLLFDGTPESILSDWQYLEKQQRSIICDIRFALFLAEKVHPTGRILKELGF